MMFLAASGAFADGLGPAVDHAATAAGWGSDVGGGGVSGGGGGGMSGGSW
jgi:hypothetical protein